MWESRAHASFNGIRSDIALTERLALPEKLDTAAVPDFVKSLRLHQGADLILDAGALKQLGALAFQTIIVAANDWQDAGHTLQIDGVSQEVSEQIQLLGSRPNILTEGDIR